MDEKTKLTPETINMLNWLTDQIVVLKAFGTIIIVVAVLVFTSAAFASMLSGEPYPLLKQGELSDMNQTMTLPATFLAVVQLFLYGWIGHKVLGD